MEFERIYQENVKKEKEERKIRKKRKDFFNLAVNNKSPSRL